MDIEQARREELKNILSGHFACHEEVRLRHALFRTCRIRADIVAIPLDPKLAGYALAFEVKEPTSPNWQTKHWIHAMRQASDYLYAEIEPQPGIPGGVGRRIAASFLYPSPPISGIFSLDSCDEPLAGALLLALHFRVGHAHYDRKKGDRFVLSFGPNEVWRSDIGFSAVAIGLLTGKRTVGSQRIDVLRSLKGYG